MAASKSKAEKYGTLRSPKGILGFGYLTKPDMKFGAKHRVQIFVDPADPEVKTFAAALTAAKVKHMTSIGRKADKEIPGLKKADAYLAEKFADRGVVLGSLYFEFETKSRLVEGTEDKYIPVDIYDASAKKVEDQLVWGGDLIRASVTVMSWESAGKHGVKPYLNSVQLLKSNGGGNRNVFTDETDGVGAEELAPEGGDSTAPFSIEADAAADTTPAKPAARATKTTKAGPSQIPTTSPSDEVGVSLDDIA